MTKWHKFKLRLHTLRLYVTLHIYRFIHTLKGEYISESGAKLRNYLYQLVMTPEKTIPQTYETMLYENTIQSYAEKWGMNRNQTILQLYFILAAFKERKEQW